ncbi:MAG: hypothetical protein FJX80_00535 [Bacteroidetes bacterium]|nr:hypothetical protein [Bacteroidota bacterium]
MFLFDKIPYSHFKAFTYRNEELWKSYEQINGFLLKNFGSHSTIILGKPFLSDNSIKWYCISGESFKPLDNFSFSEKQNLLLQYHFFLHAVNGKIIELRSTGNQDNLIWADMLSMTFLLGANILYSDGQSLVLVWGFDFKNEQENFVEAQLISSYITSMHENASDLYANHPVAETENLENHKQDSFFEVEEQIIFKKVIVRSNKKQERRNSFFRNYWWLFLFFPLIIILFFSFFNTRLVSSANSIPSNLFRRPLIDTTKIIRGDSGISLIISDIFNIALKDKTKDLFIFTTELKKQFPDSGYQIIYYDTIISRIQFKFLDSNRTALKKAIKDKMDKYDLLIWDESIFAISKIFNDPSFKYSEKTWHLTAVGASAAWEYSTGDSRILIAVLDDGFDLRSPDLNSNVVKPYNVKTRNSEVTASTDRFHGTHVASLALGRANNSFGVSGLAPDCSFMPIQLTDNQHIISSSDIIDGLLYAIKNDADIINLSLGKFFSEEIGYLDINAQKSLAEQIGIDEAIFWDELFAYAESENTTIVVAAGNQHLWVGLDPMLRSNRLIKVSAYNQQLHPAEFSNFGDLVTVYAPGEHIYGLVPNNQEKYLDGTSMACPIVAGAIGLIKAKKKNLTNEEIKTLIKENADRLRSDDISTIAFRIDKIMEELK